DSREHDRDGRGLARRRSRPRALAALAPVGGAGARRAPPALLDGHAARLARARAHLQGDGGAARLRVALVRAPLVSAAPGGRHPHVQSPLGPGRYRPGAARRADAGGRAPLQSHVRRGLSGARGQAHRDPEGARHRRAEDVEVLRQRHLPLGPARGRDGQGAADGHRPRAPPPLGPRQPRRVPGLRPPQDLHARGRPRVGGDRLPDGRHRVPRLQGPAARAHAPAPGPDPRAPPAGRGEAEGDRRDPARGIATGARGRQTDDGRRAARGADRAVTMLAPDAATQALTVRVEEFEGPLDLLLHLCRTNAIDLARLPIRTITDQYLAHLEAIQFQDVEPAGAFLVLAATLIYLKSKLLLPADEGAPEELDEEGEALRLELEARLREYARVKALGGWLAAREAEQALRWARPGGELPAAEEIPLEDLSVDLLAAPSGRP